MWKVTIVDNKNMRVMTWNPYVYPYIKEYGV